MRYASKRTFESVSHVVSSPARHLPRHRQIAASRWRLSRAQVRRGLVITVSGVVGLCMVSSATQLLYPRQRALPFKRVGALSLSFQSRETMVESLGALNQREIQLKIGETAGKHKIKDLGLSLDAEKTADTVLSYSTQERLIPFSALFEMTRWREEKYSTNFDQELARSKLDTLITAANRTPVDAAITIRDGEVIVTRHQPGANYRLDEAVKQIERLPMIGVSEVEVPSTLVMPTYQTEKLEALAEKVRRQLSSPLKVTIDGTLTEIPANTVASWISFTPNPAEETMEVSFDEAGILAALTPAAQAAYQAPRSNIVQLVDGHETSRTAGVEGRALNLDQAIAEITAQLQTGEMTVELVTSAVKPDSFYNRQYTPTNTGLTSLLMDWVNEYGPSRYSVVMKEFGGRGRAASVNPSKQYVSASIYKIYLAYAAYYQLEKGAINADANLTAGSVATCLDQMIVISSNSCAHAIGDHIGWGTANDLVRSAGFGGTAVSVSDLHTTAGDTVNFLEKLQAGSLMNSTHTSALLANMQRQIYRDGIPRGSPGITVANKVGYVEGYRHDAGIVYHPRGTYALGVFSYGGTYPPIAELTRRVNSWANQ